jgi:hypothetical protein
MAEEREDGPLVSDGQLLADVTARRTDAMDKLGRKDKTGALLTALSNPPIQAKDASIKVSDLTEDSVLNNVVTAG